MKKKKLYRVEIVHNPCEHDNIPFSFDSQPEAYAFMDIILSNGYEALVSLEEVEEEMINHAKEVQTNVEKIRR